MHSGRKVKLPLDIRRQVRSTLTWPIPPTLQISRIDHVGRVYALDIGVADIGVADIGVADIGRVYALDISVADIGVADIELRWNIPTTSPRPLGFVDAGVAIDTPDPPRTNRYMLQRPGNSRPAARSICRELVDTVGRVYTPDLGVAHIDLHEATRDQGPPAGAGPLAFVDVVVAIDTPDPPRTNRYMLQQPGNSRPAARSICRALVDTVGRVYTPDLGVAHIDLHEATRDKVPPAVAGPLAFVDVVVAIDTPDPPRTNRYMLQLPGNAPPAARSICRALPDPLALIYTPDFGVASIELHEVRCKLVLATRVRAIAFTSHIGLHHRLHLCSSRGQCNEQQDKCSEVSTALMAA